MISRSNKQSVNIKRRVHNRRQAKMSLGRHEQPWYDILSTENMSPVDDRRFARYTYDLVRGLEKVSTFGKGITVFGSARFKEDNYYYEKARELGQKLAEHNQTVVTGGGPGIMEAVNRGAFEKGGRSVGFNIRLATEQDLNKYTTDSVEFNYFFARKVMLTRASKMFVIFPGGFGTMDEFSEVLELVHTGKMPISPIVLFGSEFWKGLDDWFADKMSSWGMIETGQEGEINEMTDHRASDHGLVMRARDLYRITDDIDQIVQIALQTNPKDQKTLMRRTPGDVIL